MDILESIKMAAKTLKANKLRSILTMLGITIGNASVITIVGVGQGGQRLAAEQFESLGPNVLFIVPGSRKARNTTFDLPKTLVIRDAEAIASQVPTVKEVAPQINSRAVASYRNNNMDALVIGVTP
jgi:putative ABC transport system permease protein